MELDPKVRVSAFWWAGLESRGFGTITCHQWAELNTRVSGGKVVGLGASVVLVWGAWTWAHWTGMYPEMAVVSEGLKAACLLVAGVLSPSG